MQAWQAAGMDDAILIDLCDGNQEAVDLIRGIWKLCEVCDDLIYGDKRLPDADIHALFLWLLFVLPNNPVWQRIEVQASFRLAISNWFAANQLEKSGDREKVITAYTLRCSPYDFFATRVMAAAGPQAGDRAALVFRGMDSPDRLDDYLNEHMPAVAGDKE
jgi:hypothetical protein